jgi:DNA-binding LacI/PurR family transcriptional regulator
VNTIKRLIVTVPHNADREQNFQRWVNTILQFARHAGADLTIYATKRVAEKLSEYINVEKNQEVAFVPLENWKDLYALQKNLNQHDLLLIVMARKLSVSHHPSMEKLPAMTTRYFGQNNVMFLYPAQPRINEGF